MNIRINDTTVLNEKKIKFLEIWLDNRLNFHKQVWEIKRKVNQANLLIMIYFNKKSKGIKINTFLMLYKSLTRFQLRIMLILSIILERE